MNHLTIMGRISKTPKLIYSQEENPLAIVNFSMAVDRRFKKSNNDVDFFNCSSFGPQAEFIEKHIKLGARVLVTGRIEAEVPYEKEGKVFYGMKVKVEQIEFADGKDKYVNSEAAANEEEFVSASNDSNVPFN